MAKTDDFREIMKAFCSKSRYIFITVRRTLILPPEIYIHTEQISHQGALSWLHVKIQKEGPGEAACRVHPFYLHTGDLPVRALD